MKIVFSESELLWLSKCIRQLLIIAAQGGAQQLPLQKKIHKMRYKFTPNASKVHLTVAERALLNEIVSYRRDNMSSVSQMTEELAMVMAISKKLEERESA